jgi:hypothetical protein
MPQAAGIIAVVATVASTAVSIHGQRQQAKAAEAAAEFNAKVAENEALRVEMESREQIRRDRITHKRLLGRQRALAAKSGVTETGSPLDLMAETAGELELGILDSQRAHQAKATQLRGEATIGRFEGKSRAVGLRNRSIATGIGGISRAATQTARL